MLIISSREFRANQKSYLDKIDDGVEILIQRSKNKSYKIIPVSGDDTLMSKKDFLQKSIFHYNRLKRENVLLSQLKRI